MGYENFYNQPRMNNNYPYQNNMISAGLKGRPVSSIDEARAMQIDFDGSLFIFPDIANKRIYTKQINMDGIAVLNMYELKPIPANNSGDYITREEFESAVALLRESLDKRDEPKAAPPQEQPTQAPKQNFNF